MRRTAYPKRLHMNISKRFVLMQLEAGANPADMFNGWTGTRKEAIEAVKNMPGQFLPLSDCDNFDPNEGCLGHPE
jgi:hypothetical protein